MSISTSPLYQERLCAALCLGLFLLTVYLLTMGGHTYAPDDESMFYVTESMVRRGEFDMPNFAEYPTVSGWYGVDSKTFTGNTRHRSQGHESDGGRIGAASDRSDRDTG